MSTTKTLGLAIGIAIAAASLAFAQQGSPQSDAAASGGSGTHQTSQKTGSAANSQKVAHNQNGYRGRGHFRHYVGRAVYSYYSDGKHCHIVHHLRGPRQRICH
jgi:hypothetical protein